jgi:hypothetical protein
VTEAVWRALIPSSAEDGFMRAAADPQRAGREFGAYAGPVAAAYATGGVLGAEAALAPMAGALANRFLQ